MNGPSDPVETSTTRRKRTDWPAALPSWISALTGVATLAVAMALTGPLNSMQAYFQSEIALRNLDLLAERDGRMSAEEELSRLRFQLAREVSRVTEARTAESSESSPPFSSAAVFDVQYLLWRGARGTAWSHNIQPSQHIAAGLTLAALARSQLGSANLQAERGEVASLLSALERDCSPATSITITTPADEEGATRAYSDAIGRAFVAYNQCLVVALESSS